MAGFREHGNEPSGAIKFEEFVDYLRTSKIIKKESAPWSEYLRK